MFCHQCGAKLPDGAAFCSNCGAAQSFSSTSAPTESPVSPISPKPQKQSRHKGILAADILGINRADGFYMGKDKTEILIERKST